MSMDEFVNTLSDEQKQALLKALSGKEEQPEPTTVDEDFTMHRSDNKIRPQKRRESVRARENTWTDTGELKDVETPQASLTPRNRATPKKKQVKCHACGKTTEVNSNLVFGEYYRCDRCIGG